MAFLVVYGSKGNKMQLGHRNILVLALIAKLKKTTYEELWSKTGLNSRHLKGALRALLTHKLVIQNGREYTITSEGTLLIRHLTDHLNVTTDDLIQDPVTLIHKYNAAPPKYRSIRYIPSEDKILKPPKQAKTKEAPTSKLSTLKHKVDSLFIFTGNAPASNPTKGG